MEENCLFNLGNAPLLLQKKHQKELITKEAQIAKRYSKRFQEN